MFVWTTIPEIIPRVESEVDKMILFSPSILVKLVMPWRQKNMPKCENEETKIKLKTKIFYFNKINHKNRKKSRRDTSCINELSARRITSRHLIGIAFKIFTSLSTPIFAISTWSSTATSKFKTTRRWVDGMPTTIPGAYTPLRNNTILYFFLDGRRYARHSEKDVFIIFLDLP